MFAFLAERCGRIRDDAALRSLCKRLQRLDLETISGELQTCPSRTDAHFIHLAMLVRAARRENPELVPGYCANIIRLSKSELSHHALFVRSYARYFLGAAKNDWASAHKARQAAMSYQVRPWLRALFEMPFVPEFKRVFRPQVVSMY